MIIKRIVTATSGKGYVCSTSNTHGLVPFPLPPVCEVVSYPLRAQFAHLFEIDFYKILKVDLVVFVVYVQVAPVSSMHDQWRVGDSREVSTTLLDSHL